MRHRWRPEEAAAADLLAGGRLQLGVSRGSPEPAWQGAEAFGYPVESNDARDKTALFRKAISGAGVVAGDVGGKPGGPMLAVQPQSPGLVDRIWWGSGTRESATREEVHRDKAAQAAACAQQVPGAIR
jgi:alkanesulfonate monooxygenase SsuD/methylene tetrahydromethanopterin reductase-like flavin-dependent oxidoreductase (luciferase family)